MVMVLAPTANGRFCEALPDATATPFTVIVAVGSAAVGVMVMEVTVLATVEL